MEERKEKNRAWVSVPQFGEWDQNGPLPDYSMDFSKIREKRKQNKSRASLGNEEELISSTKDSYNTKNTNDVVRNDHHHDYHQHHSPTARRRRRSIFSCFNCCVKA